MTPYGITFFESRLYADTLLQVFFFATGVAGWWQWARGGAGHGELPISDLGAERGSRWRWR